MKTILNYFVVILLSIVSTSCRTTYLWEAKGPFNKSGPVKLIVVDKNNSNKLFAATENGGVWVIEDYTNSQEAWRPISDKLENLQIRGFDVSKHNSQKMLVGNGLGNIHISYNAGETWTKLGNSNFGYIRKIAIDDVLGTILIFNVASSKGLFKIEVRGSEQNPLIQIDTITNSEVLDFLIDKYEQNIRYYSARNEGVYKSINYGNDWEKVANSTIQNGMIKIAQPSKDGTVVLKQDTLLFIGNNSSNIFQPIAFPTGFVLGSDVGYRNPFGGRKGDWDNAIAIDPDNSDNIFVGMDKLGFSENRGNSWYNIYPGHEDLQQILFVNSDILVANDGGVFKLNKGVKYSFKNSNNNLIRPERLNKGFNTYQFYRVGVSGNNAVGNADHNGINYTQNLASTNPTWSIISSNYGRNGLENDFVYKDIKNPNRFFVLFQNKKLLRLNIPYRGSATNDLLDFHNTALALNPYSRFQNSLRNQEYNSLNYPLGTIAQDPRNNNDILLLSSHNSSNTIINSLSQFSIKMSKNSDRDPVTSLPTWNTSYRNGHVPIVSMAFSPENNGNIYALDESGKLFFKNEVNDDNEDWVERGTINDMAQDETMRQLIINKSNDANLFAVSHQKIYKSTDSGRHWNVLRFDLNQNKINSITQHHNKPDWYFIATDRGVYCTKNSGNSWNLFSEKLPNAPVMQIFTEGKYLYAVTFGRGLWRCNLENSYSRRFVHGS